MAPNRTRVVGLRRSRAPKTVSGTTMPVTSSITIPVANSTPKSWIIGTREIRIARNAIIADTVATTIGGPSRRSVSANGSTPGSRTHSSSTRLWIWIANSTPIPIRIGRPEIVTSDKLPPRKPNSPKPHRIPRITAGRGKRRHRTRNTRSSTTIITAKAIAPRLNIPPWR